MRRKVSVGNVIDNDDFGLSPAPVARKADNRAGGAALMSSWRPWAKLGNFGPGERLKLELWGLSSFLKRIFSTPLGGSSTCELHLSQKVCEMRLELLPECRFWKTLLAVYQCWHRKRISWHLTPTQTSRLSTRRNHFILSAYLGLFSDLTQHACSECSSVVFFSPHCVLRWTEMFCQTLSGGQAKWKRKMIRKKTSTSVGMALTQAAGFRCDVWS